VGASMKVIQFMIDCAVSTMRVSFVPPVRNSHSELKTCLPASRSLMVARLSMSLSLEPQLRWCDQPSR
jgi:hypothetical protein